MAIKEKDHEVLEALRKAREQHKELDEFLSFYYDLYEVQFEAKAGLPSPEVRDELAIRWRLEGGIPQLTFDQLGVEPESFGRLVSRIEDVLLRHNPAWEIEQEAWKPEALVALAREVFTTWDTLTIPEPDAAEKVTEAGWQDRVVALAVGFALAPYLQRAAEAILPSLDLSLWTQSHCPLCGGRPNFAFLEGTRGARQLMCSRCNTQWGYTRTGCPFCGAKEDQKYYPSEDGVYRLYVCSSCNRYLKTMDLRELFRDVYPAVERLLTVGMDLAAQQEGYGE